MSGGAAFLPSSISGIFQWIDLGYGVVLNGADVSSITDRSGNGHDMQQTSAADQPLFVAEAKNGLPGMTLDGTSEFMNSTEAASLWTFLHDGTDWAYYNVFEITAANPNALYAIMTTGNENSLNASISLRWSDRAGSGENDRINFFMYKASSGKLIINENASDNTFGTQAYHILNTIYDLGTAPNWEVKVDDVSVITQNNSNLPNSALSPPATMTLGARGGGSISAGITILETIIYNRALTSDENSNIVNYLNNKFAL